MIAPIGDVPKARRPIVSWAHGTTGTAQNCGPVAARQSRAAAETIPFIGGNSWTDYGVPAIEAFLKQGYAVVATDYQGLGGGGALQYAVPTTQARDAINAIRAVGAMGLAGANKKALIYGWSQGGGAVIAAASLADYIAQTGTAYDGVEMVGFVALRPAGHRSRRAPRRRGGKGLRRAHRRLHRQSRRFHPSRDVRSGPIRRPSPTSS